MKQYFGRVLTLCFVLVALMTGAASAATQTYKVLVLNFEPTFSMAGNKPQHELVDWWNDPHWLAEQFAADMLEISHGYAKYDVAEWIDIPELPKTPSGDSYTLQEYYDTLQAARAADWAYWDYSGWRTLDGGEFNFDYDGYLTRYNVYNRVDNGDFDEVWMFSGPCTGVTMYETRMVGKGAYWCNAPALEKDCRPFVVYGFNYERGVGEMLEDAGHRAESILGNIYGYADFSKDYSEFTDWEKFTAYDKVKPGKAGVGEVHFAPNSTDDYDWGNTTYVYSTCNDWANFPNMSAAPERVNCATWGNGDIREHHKWWFSLFPHVDGVNAKSGKLNNWWVYFTLDYLNLFTGVNASGYCGNEEDGTNLTWTLSEDGTLTIRGRGGMEDHDDKDDDRPKWYQYRESILSVKVESGVTELGSHALQGCTRLKTVSIPDTVTAIKSYAFLYCYALPEVTISKYVASIGDAAFEGCTGLKHIHVAADNPSYASVDGILYSKDKKTLVAYPAGHGTAFTVPDFVNSIGAHAFRGCYALTDVVFPKNVRNIGIFAFLWCRNLKTVTFSRNIKDIGWSAFYGCDSLSDVYYQGTAAQWATVNVNQYNEPLLDARIHFASACRINSIIVTTQDKKPLTMIPAGMSLATVSVTNLADTSGASPVVLLAAYGASGQYQGLMYAPVNATAEVTLSIDNNAGKIASLKAFVVNSLDEMSLLCDPASFPA